MGKGSAGLPLAGLSTVARPDDLAPKRAYNFCAGPAMLDSSAMVSLWSDFMSFEGSGMSICEMSQRDTGGPVQSMIHTACDNIRSLLHVPANYKILLFQTSADDRLGRCSTLRAVLTGRNKQAQYLDGGFWSQRAMTEATKWVQCSTVAGTVEDAKGLRYPDVGAWEIDESAAYLHIVSNETISGIELGDPDVGNAVLVADMTSTLLSRPVDVSKYGVIYASGGKNLGPAGVCVVIVRDDLLDSFMNEVPSIMSWKTMSDHDNLYNTQCIFAIWALKKITDGLLAQGGLEKISKWVSRRAAKVYAVLDASQGFYVNRVHPDFRSRTSIPVRILDGNLELEGAFLLAAQASGLHQLAGHHSVGGLRICVYNGIPDEAVDALLSFMTAFQASVDERMR